MQIYNKEVIIKQLCMSVIRNMWVQFAGGVNMKKRILCVVLAAMMSVTLIIPGLINTSADEIISLEEKVYSNATLEDKFAEDRVLVVLSNAVSTSDFNYNLSSFSDINCSSVSNLTQAATDILCTRSNGVDLVQGAIQADSITFNNFFDVDATSFHQVLCLTLDEPGKGNVLNAIEVLMKRQDVIYAGPDYEITISAVPNDEYYQYQWARTNIHLPQAWNVATGNAVTVGVIDTGIDADHPDLTNRFNENMSYSYDSALSYDIDPNGHGTHVAGIIAAQGNNSIGISGVGWNIRVASLRAFNSSGVGYSSHVASAINYATTMGIPILNLSAGWSSSDTGYAQYYDYALNSVIASYPGLFVCSAGNSNKNNDNNTHYPSNYRLPNLISVGASTQSDQRASTSNYGKTTVDIFAPGVSILSCYPTDKCAQGSDSNSIHYNDGYHYMDGTSMASPFVAGVAALILSKYPNLSASQVKSRIMKGSDHLDAFENICVSGGRLNAYIALHNHTFSYTSTSLNHTSTCTCGYNVTEYHEFTVSANEYICMYCGYSTYVLPYSVDDDIIS